MIMHYRNKTAGSWKAPLAALMTPTTLTRGCGGRVERRDKEGTLNIFFSIYLIPRFFVDNAFLLSHKDDHDSCSSTPSPRRVGGVASLTIAFAVPSRDSPSKPQEEISHRATISTADKDNHASSHEAEDQADPAPGGNIEMRAVGVERDRDQGPILVCPSQRSPMCVYIRHVAESGLP